MHEVLQRIARDIVAREEERKRLGEKIRADMEDFIDFAGFGASTSVVGAVDGGLIHDEYGSISLLLVRSVGALFSYREGSLTSVRYVPSPLPPPEVVANDMPLEREDYHPFRSLHRLRSELSRALEVASQRPDFLFLDGSIVPQMVDKPRKDNKPLFDLYLSVVSLYEKLYGFYPEIIVGGIVKDSRGNRLGIYLRDQGLDVPNWQDVAWLTYVLRPGEYTKPIPYSKEPHNHPTLKDLDEHAENVYVIYLRASASDRPYRVEFYSTKPERDARRIASLLVPLSALNPHYSIPPFMVEVDLRARLSRESLSYVKSYLERVILARFPHLHLFERRPY